MPRKPEPSFDLKQIIWDIAASVGTDNLSAILREVDEKLRQLHKKEELYTDQTPDIRTLRRIIKLDINRLAPEVVVSKLPRHVWRLRNDYEAIVQVAEERATKQKVTPNVAVEQEPYVETPHKQKMQELARSLQSEVGLPYVLEIFLPLGRSAVALSIDQEGNHLYQGLHSHLKTGGFSDVLEEIREWKDSAGLYLAKCHDLFKNVRGEIASDEVIVSPDGQPAPGLIIDDFCGTLCADVVGKVTGYPTHLGYKTERHFLRPDLWVLRYGGYGIYLGLTKEDLEKHQNMHKDIIGKYVSDAATREMATQREKLSEIGIQISRQLLKFSDMERLPGHCELC